VADEENKNLEEIEETAAADGAASDETSSPSGDEVPSDTHAESGESSSDESAADAAVEQAEPEEVLPPKERRKKAKSSNNRKQKYSGTLEERRAQRDVHRKKKAVQRRKHRLEKREEHKAAGPREGTPVAVKQPGTKKIQQGTVVSDKTDKTISVAIDVMESHRMYKKIVRRTKKVVAHDETNNANEGDTVRVIESRPLSKTKRWRLVDVVERAK
jgi:small subunit ribosomal protein S17